MIAAWWSIRCWSRGRSSAAPRKGIGGALFEEFHYDAEGQLLTGSFMDYMLPTACDIPDDADHPPAFAVAAQSARRQGRRRRRPDCAAGRDRQCGVRRAASVQGRVQSDADQAAADRSRPFDRRHARADGDIMPVATRAFLARVRRRRCRTRALKSFSRTSGSLAMPAARPKLRRRCPRCPGRIRGSCGRTRTSPCVPYSGCSPATRRRVSSTRRRRRVARPSRRRNRPRP